MKLKESCKYAKALLYNEISAAALAVAGTNMMYPRVHADALDQVVDVVFQIIAMAAFASGAVMVAIGIVQFAMARSEEGGPQEQKAINKLVAGISLIGVGALLQSGIGDTLKTIVTSNLQFSS